MAKLDAAERRDLPKADFALPGRRYPVNDKVHAKAALSRVSANGTPKEKAKVRQKVKSKFSDIQVTAFHPGR